MKPSLGSLRKSATLAGAIGLLLCAIGVFADRPALFQSYLVTWWFLLGVALGSAVILMVHQLTGGAWGVALRAPLLAATRTIPALAVFFVPLALGYHELYTWAAPTASDNALLVAKSWYLNTPFFWGRAVFYLVLWSVLTTRYARLLVQSTADGNPASTARLQVASVVGLILYALSVSFAAVDWIMSLTPEWYSTSWGLLVMLGQALGAFAFAIVAAALLTARPNPRADADLFNDWGNLLLMFVMTWAYLAYTQYLIIWAENLPHEIIWYVSRTQTSWKWIGIVLVVFHFALPFVLLLFRFMKRSMALLAGLAALLVVAHWIDALWLIAPSLRTQGVQIYWTDFAALLGLGGAWLALFLHYWQRLPARLDAPTGVLALKAEIPNG